MSRDKDLAGKTVSKGGYNITYDENGYATKATNYKSDHFAGTEKSKAAQSADSVKGSSDRGSYGGSSYDQNYFTDAELKSAAELRDMAASGKISWAEAHDYVERVRGKYGYSGGQDGSKFIASDLSPWGDGGGAGGGRGGFSYGSAPSYTSRYQGQIDDLTAQILGREAFTYDPEKDPTYQQYKESYTRNGERAMQDTLGQVSARTGGLASSYASSAAQQTYDGYMSALADKIPELRQLAYSMYQDEGNEMRANLEMLMALEQGDYAKYTDLLGQWNTDRNFDYGVHRDQISDNRYNNEWNYQVGRDDIADKRYEDETAWERSQYTSEKEYNQALAKAQTLAAAGDFSGYKALGYTDAEIKNLKTAYDRAQAAALLTKRRGTTGGSPGSGAQDYNGLFKAAMESGHAKSFIANNYKKFGFTSSSDLYDDYIKWEENGGDNSGTDGGTGEEGYSLNDLDTSSVLALGLGPISFETVQQLAEQGKVDVYTGKNGKLTVGWMPGYNAQNYKNSLSGGLMKPPFLPNLR